MPRSSMSMSVEAVGFGLTPPWDSTETRMRRHTAVHPFARLALHARGRANLQRATDKTRSKSSLVRGRGCLKRGHRSCWRVCTSRMIDVHDFDRRNTNAGCPTTSSLRLHLKRADVAAEPNGDPRSDPQAAVRAKKDPAEAGSFGHGVRAVSSTAISIHGVAIVAFLTSLKKVFAANRLFRNNPERRAPTVMSR